MSRDYGGPAFPDDGQMDYTGGMTLLDYFAGLAMQGMISNDSIASVGGIAGDIKFFARTSYAAAEAMIEERKKWLI